MITRRSVPVLSYPSGVYSSQELEMLPRLGLPSAATTNQGQVSYKRVRSDGEQRCAIPPWPHWEDGHSIAIMTAGAERVKQLIKPLAGGFRTAAW